MVRLEIHINVPADSSTVLDKNSIIEDASAVFC